MDQTLTMLSSPLEMSEWMSQLKNVCLMLGVLVKLFAANSSEKKLR